MHKKRIGALINELRKNNVDALLITKPENIFYLTSFVSGNTALVVSPKKIFAVTDFIYAEAASKILSDFELYTVKDVFVKTIVKAVRKHKIKRLGFESFSLSFHRYGAMKRELKNTADLIATKGMIESLREIKDEKEILAIKKSIKITAETFTGLKKKLRPGITELSASRYIKELFIKKGADGYSFEPIVAAPPSSSQPHYRARAKKLGYNKAILVDMGARLGGYNSDLTRVCPLGKISSKFVNLYNVLLEAQKRALERIRPGVKVSDIDLTARQYIDKKGVGRFFGHALGHGIGLEIHEKPSISHNNHEILKPGMVFTVEPGIYIPGLGGLRVEDMVCVNRGGCEILTDDIDKSI